MSRDLKFWGLIGFVFIAAVAGVMAYLALTAPLSGKLRLGADPVNSEPYEMATAIAHVISRTYPGLEIEVVPTGGSSENMNLLTSGELDLALVQAEVISRENVSLLAVLYHDLFQLLVRDDSGIEKLKDLEGKRIALPPVTTGQYRAFWFLANHYGLAPERIIAIPMNTYQADEALVAGQIDAIFRVRGPRNSSIRVLFGRTDLRFIPIDQGDALHLRQPAYTASFIPKGSYRGDPATPAEALPTVAVDRLLVARDEVPEEIVRAITSVLFEKRRDLALRTPLAALIRQPEIKQGTMLPVHGGALSYYEREKPSFLEEKAEFLALIFSVLVVLTSLAIAFTRRFYERQKGRIEDYSIELLELEKSAKGATSIPDLDICKHRLTEILAEAVDDMRHRRINAEGLQLFSFVWESVNYTINDHEEQLRLGPGPSGYAGGSANVTARTKSNNNRKRQMRQTRRKPSQESARTDS
ncbi:MAG: TAXI family TRAP transporter solute-binding subunit [Hyphomicrobiaceae bacterium]|nr:TAXI family TRAP transporter solute-binding subunit [Hyphomicrobiaceae bacterium]